MTLTHRHLALEDYLEGDGCQKYADAWEEQLTRALGDARIKGDEVARLEAELAQWKGHWRTAVAQLTAERNLARDDTREARRVAAQLLRVARALNDEAEFYDGVLFEEFCPGGATGAAWLDGLRDREDATSAALAALEPGVRRLIDA